MKNIFLCIVLLLMLTSCKQSMETKSYPILSEEVSPLYDSSLKPFYHSVASGDPMIDRVIIWTRVTPENIVPAITVGWEMADDEGLTKIIKSDSVITNPEKDYTVKVDVTGLEPGRHYYYRFKALGKTSPVGRTKTVPVGSPDSLRFAVVSCANWEWGYFNAYDRIAEQEVDAVLHLGDYIYEYGVGTYGDTTIGRINLPKKEIISLQDYRTRHSQYRTDVGLRHVSERHPMIAIWDDHEIANNSYSFGAENHQANVEGAYAARKAAAKQAYYEWLPIREGKKHYRAFTYGDLADLIMLDERLEGRSKPPESTSDPEYSSTDQHMLGSEQVVWLEEQLTHTSCTWKIIGNQVIFSEVDQSKVFPKSPRNLDSWDGYPVERERIADFIQKNTIQNIVFVTGDTHGSWAFEVALDTDKTYNSQTTAGAFAVEFGTPSISSSNWDEYSSVDEVKKSEQQLIRSNPHLKFGNAREHGYLLLTLFRDSVQSDWYYVETLRKPDNGEHLGMSITVKKDTHKLDLLTH